ncbi:MAG: hypothetical protein PHG29_10675 [Prolixibacteraceae bacterium]|uniref:hypothetical protein n=1 Tax=Methanocorpusculum sp. GPch4 TaxID=2527877 RepID=UPI001432B3D8|nr:hypothetical protein [Methanocorpusculum sp. GPch4]MDD4756531.1 hypothetical protein [Prolixibacteraceae bacterium]
MESASFESEEKLRRELIAILLSASKSPVPTRIKFQKELFLLTRSFPKFEKLFPFTAYRFGPYSSNAEAILENNDELFIEDKYGIHLTDSGKRLQEKAESTMSPNNREMLRKVSEMISTICQNMNDEELMYLIYTTYGYEKHSDIYQHLYEKRETIAKRLYNKGIISYQKYQELLE